MKNSKIYVVYRRTYFYGEGDPKISITAYSTLKKAQQFLKETYEQILVERKGKAEGLEYKAEGLEYYITGRSWQIMFESDKEDDDQVYAEDAVCYQLDLN